MFGPAPDVRSATWTGTAIRAKVGGLSAQSTRQSSVVSSVTASRDLGEMAAGGVLVAAFPFLGSRFCVPVSEGTTRFGIYYPAPHEAKVSQALEEQGKNSRNCR